MIVEKGKVSVDATRFNDRTRGLVNALKPIAHLLPDITIALSLVDEPTLLIAHADRERHLAAAREGPLLDDEAPKSSPHRLTDACSPNSAVLLDCSDQVTSQVRDSIEVGRRR